MWRRGCPGQCRTLACSFLRCEWRQAGLLESRMQPTARRSPSRLCLRGVGNCRYVVTNKGWMAPEGSGTSEVCQFAARFSFGESVTRIHQPQVTAMYGSVVPPTLWANVYGCMYV